jgi:hypothetical protein
MSSIGRARENCKVRVARSELRAMGVRKHRTPFLDAQALITTERDGYYS